MLSELIVIIVEDRSVMATSSNDRRRELRGPLGLPNARRQDFQLPRTNSLLAGA